MLQKSKNERQIAETLEPSIINTPNDLGKKEWKDTGKRHHNCPFSIGKEKEIIEKYLSDANISAREVGKLYNVSYQTIFKILVAHNIKSKKRTGRPSKYFLDDNFLDRIDTQEKAYILGLLYADGNVCSVSPAATISLQDRDKDILFQISKLFKSTRPIFFTKKKKKQYKDQYRLYLYSDNLVKSLKRLGCVPAKSLILKFPTPRQVPNSLIRHFIRGYFDGDGCIYDNIKNFYKNKKYNKSLKCRISIISTFEFLKKLKQVCNKNINIKFSLKKLFDKKHPNNNITSELALHKIKDIIKFCEWIYEDSSIHFERKYFKYNNFIKEYKNFYGEI